MLVDLEKKESCYVIAFQFHIVEGKWRKVYKLIIAHNFIASLYKLQSFRWVNLDG